MSKTILANFKGWTPTIDNIVAKHGIITAHVFGVIWQYCQLSDGVCTASQETISKRTGISIRSIRRHTNKLVEDGYLTVLKNNGYTSTYADTGKAAISTSVDTGLTTITISMKAS